jgi:hypothetical protein
MANWHVSNDFNNARRPVNEFTNVKDYNYPKRHANKNHNNIMTHEHATLQKNSRPNSRKHGKKTYWNYYGVFNYNCNLIKQWLLARKFSECKYSPKNVHFWQEFAFPKMVFFGNLRYLPESPTFINHFCEDSPDSRTFAKGHL